MKRIVLLLIITFSSSCFAQLKYDSDSSFDSNLLYSKNIHFQFDRERKPRLNFEKITLESIVGLGVGYLAAFSLKKESDGILNVSEIFRVFAIVGGTSGSVYLMGSLDRETGNFPITFGSTAIGGILFGLIGNTDNALTGDDLIYRFIVPGAVLGAVIGFNKTRKYKKRKSKTSIFNYDKSGFEIGLPNFSFKKNSYHSEFELNLIDFRI